MKAPLAIHYTHQRRARPNCTLALPFILSSHSSWRDRRSSFLVDRFVSPMIEPSLLLSDTRRQRASTDSVSHCSSWQGLPCKWRTLPFLSFLPSSVTHRSSTSGQLAGAITLALHISGLLIKFGATHLIGQHLQVLPLRR